MEYNKDKFIKTNDKKVLHKVKKQWVVLSMSLLALLGGGAVAHQAAAHADPANRQNANPAAALKDRINASLMKTQSNSSYQTSAAAQTQGQSQASVTNIRQQAVQLHNRIVSNAVLTDSQSRTNHEAQGSSNSQSQANSFANSISSETNHQNLTSTSNNTASRSVSSSAINIKNDRADHNLDNSKVASANQTSLKANEQLNPAQHLVGSVHTGTYNNLTYTSDGSGDIEFTGGKLTDGSDFVKNLSLHTWGVVYSIKFDSDVDTGQMTDAVNMFSGNSYLMSVTLPSNFGQNITSAQNMFSASSGLESITLPNGFGPKITNASSMFESDVNLAILTLPSGFGQNITNASQMFGRDKDLDSLTLPSDFGQNITNASGMFRSDVSFANRNDNFSRLQVDSNGTPADPRHLACHWIDIRNYRNLEYTDDGHGNIEFIGGKLTYYNSSDNNYSFLSEAPSDIQNATSIKFDSDVDSSQLTDAAYMFYKGDTQTQLTSVTLPSDFGKNIRNATCMFWGSDLSNVTLPRDFGPNITDANTMFSGKFTNLTLPSGFGPNISDASFMFSLNPDLESITLPNGFGQKITNASFMFESDANLAILTLPSDFGRNITHASQMFHGDSSFANRSDNFNQLQMSDYGTPADPHHLAGHWIDAHNYRNLEYTSDGQGHIEFLKGTLSDGSDFVHDAPLDIKQATALKFDSDIDYSQFTDASSMFSSDNNLIDLTLPNNFGKHISNGTYMFFGPSNPSQFYKNNNLTPMNINTSGTPLDPHQLAGHWISNVYHGVEYVSDGHNHVEFTRGKLSNCSGGTPFLSNAPSDIKNATSLKFDSDIDYSRFSDAAKMFGNDSNLTNITLPDDFGQNITDAPQMFGRDKDLASLTLPSDFGQNITDASGMFESDANLARLTLLSGFGQNITDAPQMFGRDKDLASLTLPSDFGQNITDASGMFESDANLARLTLPSDFGINISKAPDMFESDAAFYRLKRDGNTSDQLNSDSGKLLEKVSDLAGHWIDQQIQQYDGLTYKYDKASNTIEFTKGKLNWNSSQGGFLADAPRIIRNASTIKFDGESGASDQPNSQMNLGNLQDMANMFASDDHLKHLELNANFKSLKPTNLFNALGEDPNLQSLDLSDLDTSAVTDMSNLFTNDLSLQSIKFGSGWNTSHVTDMAAMFMNDQDLTVLDLSHFDTRQVRSMLDMFSGDLNLTQLNVSKFSTANVGNMAAMFYNLPELKSLDVSSFNTAKVHDMNSMFARDNLSQIKGLDRFNTGQVRDMNNLFFQMPNLKTLNLSNFDTRQVTDMLNMFGADYRLSDLTLGNQFTTPDVTNDRWMFQMDNNLKNLRNAPSGFRIDAAAMFSPNTKRISTTLANLSNRQGQSVMKTIQTNEPLVGDWFSTGTDTLEYYIASDQQDPSDNGVVVGTQAFHGEKGQTDYTLKEMTSDTLFGLDTSKYYLTSTGNTQISNLAFDSDLKFNGAMIRIPVAPLAQSSNTIDYTYNGRIVASLTLTGSKETSDTEIVQDLHQIARGDFIRSDVINGNDQYGLTNDSKNTANRKADHVYQYDGSSVTIPVDKITDNEIDYVNSDNQPIYTQPFSGLDQQNDPQIDLTMHQLLKNPSDLSSLSISALSDYILSNQGIHDAQAALPPYQEHHYGDRHSVTIHVERAASNRLVCEDDNGSSWSDTYSGRPGKVDSDLQNRLKGLLQASDGLGNYYYSDQGYLAKSDGVKAINNALKNCHYDGSTVTVHVSDKPRDVIELVNGNYQVINNNQHQYQGIPGHRDSGLYTDLKNVANNNVDLGSDYYLPQSSIKTAQADLKNKRDYDYQPSKIIIPVKQKQSDVINLVNGNQPVGSYHYRGIPGQSDHDFENQLSDMYRYRDYQYQSNDGQKYYLSDSDSQQAKQALQHQFHDYHPSTVTINVHREPSDVIQYYLNGKFSASDLVASDRYSGIPGYRDSDVYNVLNGIANGNLDIGYEEYFPYFLSDTGIQQAKQALNHQYDYHPDTVKISVEQMQSDVINFVLPNNSQPTHEDGYQGIPGQKDFDIIARLKSIADGSDVAVDDDENQYYVTPNGVKEAQQAEQNHYDYHKNYKQNPTIEIKPQPFDHIQYILYDPGHSDDKEPLGSDFSYQGIPGQTDSADQGLLNDTLNGVLDGLSSDVYQPDPTVTRQDVENILHNPLHYYGDTDTIRVRKVQYGTDTINFYYQGRLINTMTSSDNRSGYDDDDLGQASRSTLNHWINSSDYYVNDDEMNAFKKYAQQKPNFQYNGTVYNMNISRKPSDIDTVAFVDSDNQVVSQRSWSDVMDHFDNHPSQIVSRDDLNNFDPTETGNYQLSVKGQYEMAEILNGDFQNLDFAGNVLKVNVKPKQFATFTAIYTVNGRPKFKTVVTGLRDYRVDGKDYLNRQVDETLDNGDQVYLGPEFNLPAFNQPIGSGRGGLVIDPLWHGADGVHFTFKNNVITIPLVSREITNRFIYKDQSGHIIYIANLTGRTDSYPSSDTQNKDGVPMPVGVPNLNDSTSKVGSDTPFPDVLKQYNYSPNFKGIRSARFTGMNYVINVQKKPANQLPQLKSFAVNYVDQQGKLLSKASYPIYSDMVKAIQDRQNNLTGKDNTSQNLSATLSNLGGLPTVNGVPYSIDDSDVINQLDSDHQPYYVDLNVVPEQVTDHIQFVGDDAADQDVKGVLTKRGHVDPPKGFYFLAKNPITQQPLTNNNGNFTFNGQLHTFYVAPSKGLTVPVVFYQNGDRSDVVASDRTTLSGKTGHQLPVYYYVQNDLPSNYRIASDGNRIVNALDNYTIGTDLSDQDGQYGLYGGAAQNNNLTSVTPICIPITNKARLTIQYQDVSHGQHKLLPESDDFIDDDNHIKDQLTLNDLQLGRLRSKTGTIYHIQNGYLPPEVTNMSQLITIPVLPIFNKMQFVLSLNNVPQNYLGPQGIISSDDSDYNGVGHNSYIFNNNQTNTDGIKGLPANYHIAGQQTVPYDGLTHQIQIAPNQETGTINYVYTDVKNKLHTIKSVANPGKYDVQVYINGHGDTSNEVNPGLILNQKNRFTVNGQTYQLVHQQSDDNQLIFKDGQLLNPDRNEQDNPADANYNPSNNVLNVPVKPVGTGTIHIDYFTQAGRQLASDVFSGNDDSDLDSTTKYTNASGNHTVKPGNHIVSDNPDPEDYQIDSTAAVNSDYNFTSHEQYITVPLVGKQTADPKNHGQSQSDGNDAVRVNIYTGNQQGSNFQFNGHPKYVTMVHLNGQIGSFINFGPSDLLNPQNSDGSKNPLYYGNLKDSNHSDVNLSHYVTDPSRAGSSFQHYYLRGNGNQSATLYHAIDKFPTASAESPSPATVNFYYDASSDYSTDVQPITVKYIDQHGHQIGNYDVITPTNSDYGQKINVTNSDSQLNAPNGKTAKGMSVPNGYHLIKTFNPSYQITNYKQTAELHVQGNQRQINGSANSDALPITIVANVYQSNGITPDTQTKDTVSDGQGHSEQFSGNVTYKVTPKLIGNIGDSDVISAASYQPQINDQQQMVESTGANKYTVHFKQPQKNQSDISVDGVTNPTSSGIIFSYKIVDKPQAQQRNYIHYISYSDVDNRGDITTQPNHQDFPTQVSDASSDNSKSFSDKYYRENVPTGYQFYKVYSVNGNTNDSQISKGLTQFGNGQFGDGKGPGEEYIEVIPNASPITFHYINQNGSDVKDVQLSGNGSDQTAASGEGQHTSRFGTQIKASDINKSGQPNNRLGVPQGYQYNALTNSQNRPSTIGETQPVFSRDPQDVYIPVVGTTYGRVNLKFQQNLSDANHHTSNLISDHVSDAQVGRNYSFYGFNLSTPSTGTKDGYTLDYNGHPSKVTVHINPNHSYSFVNPSDNPSGQAQISNDQGGNVNNISNSQEISFDPGTKAVTNPPRASFWYHVTDNTSEPLTLIYINQAGQQVGCADKMQGTIGSDVNVIDPAKGGEPVPDHYQLDSNQTTQYRFTDQPRTVYLHIQGQPITSQIMVYTIAQNSDGTVTFGHQARSVSGANGSLISVSPADYYPDEVNDPNKDGSQSKYSIDYSKDSEQFVRLARNQNGQIVAAPNRIIFYYVHRTTDGAPITLRYINHKTGQEVGYTKVINGNLNDKIDVASSDPAKGDLAGEDVPVGYQIDSDRLSTANLVSSKSQHPVYQFSASPQMLNIPVTGNPTPKNLMYHIHIFKESADGTIQGPASDVALYITGNVGDTIHISPYGFSQGSDVTAINDNHNQTDSYNIPQGYHATNLDLDRDIQINANGQLSPDNNTNYFYRQNYQAPQIGTVRIHYIIGTIGSKTAFDNNGAPTNGAQQVDMVSDKGIVGNAYTPAGTFNLTPYRDDIPEELSTNYESADNALNKDGSQIKDDSTNNQWQYSENDHGFANGIRDVYIQVTERNTNGTDNNPIIIS